MSAIFTGTIAHALKETLEEIIDDDLDGAESDLVYPKWCDTGTMSDNYEDDLEMGGPGLAAETAEGTSIPAGTVMEGVVTRYISRKFALKLIVTEEAIEDNKYPKVIDAARRLKRAMYKTCDIDITNMLVRATNASYLGGDGVSLASASHTLPTGGTYSNTMAVPMSPSRIALITATSAIRKLPGHDGVTEGYEPKKVVYPTEQWGVWDGILGSSFAPEVGQFNEINVVSTDRLGVTGVPVKYWTNTTTNWAIKTDVENGVNMRYRRRPRSRTWVDNDQEVMNYGISARWARGWSDPRGIFFVDA